VAWRPLGEKKKGEGAGRHAGAGYKESVFQLGIGLVVAYRFGHGATCFRTHLSAASLRQSVKGGFKYSLLKLEIRFDNGVSVCSKYLKPLFWHCDNIFRSTFDDRISKKKTVFRFTVNRQRTATFPYQNRKFCTSKK